jgi:heat shock protein HslJ
MRHSHRIAVGPLVFVALAGSVLAGCASSAGSGELTAQDVTGVWAQVDSTPRVYLELAKDGALSGSDGCNQLTGSWEISGSEVDLGQVGSTMMACEDVDTWLSNAATATVSGDTLTVLDASDKKIGTLERSS